MSNHQSRKGSAQSRRRSRCSLLSRDGNGTGNDDTLATALCAYCGRVIGFSTCQRERIDPGGSYGLANLLGACWPCNREKSDRTDWTPPRLRMPDMASIDVFSLAMEA